VFSEPCPEEAFLLSPWIFVRNTTEYDSRLSYSKWHRKQKMR
jgi:hypothetical protein